MSKAKTTNEAAKKKPVKNTSAKKADTSDDETPATVSDANTETPAAVSIQSAPAAANEETGSQLDGVALPAASGKAGVLGGPRDRGVKPEDKLALPAGRHFTYERVHSLNPKSFYCAMRWDYRILGKSPEEGKRWWANKKLLVTNPANGKQVVVRAVDYGPHENTGLTISLSPAALEALDLEIGGEATIEFADQKAALGIVNQQAV
jgi:hypothetical protein